MTKDDEQKIKRSLINANKNFENIATHLRAIYLFIILLTLGFFIYLL